ncbi:MAG: YceI family protein [Myxococcales bacterium]|nr:YceI family protein [Myxococcales bacterium]
MPRFDAHTAECFVYAKREGLLSAVGHDLKLRVAEFHVSVDDARTAVEASFRADSIEVVSAMHGDRPSSERVSDRDRREIEANARFEVLDAKRHPDIAFHSTRVATAGDGWTVEGALRLHGTERSIRVSVKREGSVLVARTTLHQPDFGIRPFRAMLGALKIQPDVGVEIRIPEGPEGEA